MPQELEGLKWQNSLEEEMGIASYWHKRRSDSADTLLALYLWGPFLYALTKAIYGPGQFEDWVSWWPRIEWMAIAVALFICARFLFHRFIVEYRWIRADQELLLKTIDSQAEKE